MVKYFCDICGEEIYADNKTTDKEGQPGRLGVVYKGLMLEVTTGLSGVWNKGLFCKYCILDGLYSLDDRGLKK